MRLKTVFIGCLLSVISCWLLFFSLPSSALARLEEGAGRFYFEPTKADIEADLFGPPEFDMNSTRNMNSMVTQIIGILNKESVGLNSETIKTYGITQRPGAIQIASNLTSTLISHPPASTQFYLADLGSSLGLAKPAYAQTGTGWSALGGVLDIWKVFRNLSYLCFVLIFIAIGFMIMFRTKINPQTVISVEAAIPNLIITLIIITFSYAIASLMIDLVWVLIYLAINIFTSYGILGNNNTLETLKTDLLGKSVIGIGFSGALLGTGESAWGEGIAGAAARAIGKTVDSLLLTDTAAQGSLAGAVSSGLAYLIVAIAILFSMFKVFFMLLMSYVGLILSVIFAPFQLLGNAFPGSNSLSGWLKGMLANVLVFPATAIMFMLAAVLTGATTWGANPNPGGTSGIGALPLLGGGDPNTFKGLIGLGMIMMMPKVLEMIKAALKVEKGAVSPAGAMAPMVGVMGMPGGALGQVTQLLTAQHYIGQAFRSKDGAVQEFRPQTGEGQPRG